MPPSPPPHSDFQLPKHFAPLEIEQRWIEYWDERQLWRADPGSSRPPFCMVLPPPNITGVLHMGHAFTVAIEDCIARYKRMQGFEVLFVPGLDHAGIATQTVVERHLQVQTGKAKNAFTREEFLEKTWEWKERHQKIILDQIKRLGASCDWSRLCFSLDAPRNQAVVSAFHRFYEQGLIYRDHYLVNWDPKAQTALSDDEVEYEERDGSLWTVRYQLDQDRAKPPVDLFVATTRPETLLGDTALAVSPSDSRYTSFIGKRARVPLLERSIPVIADAAVSPDFGTGIVKITPAHDHLDYQIGRRHNLNSIEVIGPDGTMLLPPDGQALPYLGLPALQARQVICEDLQKAGALVKQQPHRHRVGLSYRSRAIVEPRLSMQWFFKLSAFRATLRQAVETSELTLMPKIWQATYFHWIDNLRDWCISRQLWWGHRIPVWHNSKTGEMVCSPCQEPPLAARQVPEDWSQDEDVLDTWFSSALWPLSALGWPAPSILLEKFYPNQLLETGCDILFFWVARMCIFGKLNGGQWPFPRCYLHGLIYSKSYWRSTSNGNIQYVSDEERAKFDLGAALPADVHSKWEKMSKSKGNVINPKEIVDSYGTDAARMALLASATKLPQIDLDRRKFEEFKHFTNKVWNGARFVLHALQTAPALTPNLFAGGLDHDTFALEDRWLISRLQGISNQVEHYLDNFDLDRAAQASYEFYWGEFCAHYLEIAKPVLNDPAAPSRCNKQKLLSLGLLVLTRLLHPMAPFISEEIFSRLKCQLSGGGVKNKCLLTQEAQTALAASCCMSSPWPKLGSASVASTADCARFASLVQVARALRNVRAELKMSPAAKLHICVIAKDAEWFELQAQQHIARALTPIEHIERVTCEPSRPCALAQASQIQLFVLLPELLLLQEQERLARELQKLDVKIEKTRQLLSDLAFTQKAPPQILAKRRKQLELHIEDRERLVLASEKFLPLT